MNPLDPSSASVEKQGKHTALLRVAIVLAIAVVILGTAAAIVSVMTGKKSLRALLPAKLGGTKQPTVEVKQKYQNPFNQNSQYVNPFDQSKNPFRNL